MKITHDFHIHTNLSVCADKEATVEKYIKSAENIGLNKIGFANHMWEGKCGIDDHFYDTQDFEHILKIKPEIEKVRTNIKIYFGCEAEYNPENKGVALTEEAAEKLDFIFVPNSHTHLTMPKNFYEPYEKHRDFMVKAYENILNCNVSKYITAMAHPFSAVACPYDKEILVNIISDDVFKRLFSKTADKGIYVEINTAPFMKLSDEETKNSDFMRMFSIAKECGCKFVFGSDAHKEIRKEMYEKAELITKTVGICEKDIGEIL